MADRLTFEIGGDAIGVRWTAERSRWLLILDHFKRQFGHIAAFDGDTRSWRVPSACRYQLLGWARRWFDQDQIVDRTDRGWRHQRTSAPRLEDAYRALHLRETAPDELISSAYRILAKDAHPDHGGSDEAIIALNEAVATIRQHQKVRP